MQIHSDLLLFDMKMANCHKTKKEWETTTEVFDEGHDWLSALADLFFFIVGLSTQLYYTGKNENANIIKVHKSWCFLKSRPLGWLMTTTLLAYFQKLVDLWEFWLECPMSIMTIVKCLANFFLKIYKRKKWLSIPNYYIFP